jgi:23S rRNA pseudouridine1911/1915/1917 synthase
MAYIKHPILGDHIYGDNSGLAERQMLHAFRLSFQHPKTGITKTYMALPPKDFVDCVANLKLKVPKWKDLKWEESKAKE